MKNRHWVWVIGAFVLHGCGGGGGGSSGPTTSGVSDGSAVGSGFAVDDYVIGGQVSIYSAQTGKLLEQTVTSDYGKFTWSNKVTGTIRIEVSGGVEDIDGLASSTNDQKPFARLLTTLVDAATNTGPVTVSALTTGIESYANGDIAKFTSAVDALDPNLRSLVVFSDVAGDPAQQKARLETLKALTSSVGFDSVVTELADDGKLNQSVSVSSDTAANVAAASTVQGDMRGIQDVGLRTCIADVLEKNAADVTLSDFGAITSLNCNDYGVYSIAGISRLSNLQSFICTNCEISDISEFSSMPSIGALSIRNNRVKTIAPLLTGQFASLQMDISDNCVTDIALLGGTTKINASGYGNPNHQYSTCYKNDADVYVFKPYVTTTGAYTLLYRTSYNTASVCSVDWGDGTTSQAFCDNKPRRVTHAYSSPPSNPVRFLVNGVVKEEGIFPGSAAYDILINPFAMLYVNTMTYRTGFVFWIRRSSNYDNATVQGLGTESEPNGLALLTDLGSGDSLAVQQSNSFQGNIFNLPDSLGDNAIPAGTSYTVKLYKGTTLVRTVSISLKGAVVAPSSMTPSMFPVILYRTYAELCPGGVNTTNAWYSIPTSLPNSPNSELMCSPTMVFARIESGDSSDRRFHTEVNGLP